MTMEKQRSSWNHARTVTNIARRDTQECHTEDVLPNEGLNKDMFFRIKNDSITRGHSLALVKSHSRLDIRKYTFSQRVVNDWNKLPEECINATSVNMFKNKIDQYYLKTRRE